VYWCRQRMASCIFDGMSVWAQARPRGLHNMTLSYFQGKQRLPRYSFKTILSKTVFSEPSVYKYSLSANMLTLLQVASAGASARIYTLGFPQDNTRALFFW